MTYEVIHERAGYKLIRDDYGNSAVIHQDKIIFATREVLKAIEYYSYCAKEKSAPAATDADRKN